MVNKIDIKFLGPFREITNETQIELTVEASPSIKEIITILIDRYGENFKNGVYDRNNELKESAGIILNNMIVPAEKLDLRVKDGDTVIFTIAPISGGC